MLSFGRNGDNLGSNAFLKVHSLYFVSNIICSQTLQRSIQALQFQTASKLSIKRFPLQRITADAPLFHPLPHQIITRPRWYNPCLGSTAQHISVSKPSLTTQWSPYHHAQLYHSGFLTGKAQTIPWGSLATDPTSWIMEECIPNGFEWKDPSKIQIKEVFRLLDHWRARHDEGLEPLIWVSTCPLFKDDGQNAKHVRASRQARALQPPDSDEEVITLPKSDDIDQNSKDHSEEPHGPSEDTQTMSLEHLERPHSDVNNDVHMDPPDKTISGESPFVCLCALTEWCQLFLTAPSDNTDRDASMTSVSPTTSREGEWPILITSISLISLQYLLDIVAGPSRLTKDRPEPGAPIKQPYTGKGTWYIEIPERKAGK